MTKDLEYWKARAERLETGLMRITQLAIVRKFVLAKDLLTLISEVCDVRRKDS